MQEFEFTIDNGQVTGESRVEGGAAAPVHISSDATFSIGTDAITETLKTDHGTRVLDFSQDASDPKIYDLVKTSWDPSQESGDGSGHHHWTDGHSGSGLGDGSGHSWGGGHGLGAINPGGPIDVSGVGDPVSAHGPGPVQLPGETWASGHGSDVTPAAPVHPGPTEPPGLETHIAEMHAGGGSLI